MLKTLRAISADLRRGEVVLERAPPALVSWPPTGPWR
jgi:hypothetical protein